MKKYESTVESVESVDVVAVQRDNVGMAAAEIKHYVQKIVDDVKAGIFIDPFVDENVVLLEQHVRELLIAVVRHHDAHFKS